MTIYFISQIMFIFCIITLHTKNHASQDFAPFPRHCHHLQKNRTENAPKISLT